MYPAGIAAFIRMLGVIGAFPTRVTDDDALALLIDHLHPLAPATRFLRLGGAGDGGYLLPDDLEGITSCWSAGVGSDSRFERDCGDRGIDVFLADGSVSGPPDAHARFHFTRKFVGAVDGDGTMTLQSWMAVAPAEPLHEMLLKLDVEGAEYEVLLAAPVDVLAHCRVVVVECHQLDHLWSRPFFRIASQAFEKLLRTHACVHIHPNNGDGVLHHRGYAVPPTMEFTFLRRDRLPDRPTWRSDFPHVLDQDNTAAPALVLPRCWHR
jgi:hypothetical protein